MRRTILAVAVVVAATLAPARPAQASGGDRCSYGDARSQFETLPLTFDGTNPPCTYRLFGFGPTFTFSEQDFFLGGIVRRVAYQDEASRLSAIATVETLRVRVWLAEIDANGATGPLVEQVVERTAIKSNNYEPFGTHVWAQFGIIRNLPAGEYLSVTVRYPNGVNPLPPDVVRLVVTPTS